MEYCIVLSTFPDEKSAAEAAEILVRKRLAACINILPKLKSVYIFEGELQKDTETLLIIKSRSAIYKQLEAKINELHPYKVPEIIAADIKDGLNEYLEWMNESVRQC